MPDHSPPKFEVIDKFCRDVQQWFSQDKGNVAAVHCKAGKGRTGTMICCFLLRSGQVADVEEALSTFSLARTRDGRGVTIPSQRRYIRYFDSLLRGEKEMGRSYEETRSVLLRRIVLEGAKGLANTASYLQFHIVSNLDAGSDKGCGHKEVVDIQGCTVLVQYT